MKRLLELIKHGQSYWMDNLSRAMIESGALEKRVTEQGLRGITSNPTIFNKAISSGSDYDEQIRELVARNEEVHEIYEALAVKDVQDACDILRPVFVESDGVDGFVSLEVSPYLAHDTEGTMSEVRRLFNAVDRPNVFIKIPGTEAGVPAIQEMLYEGININITLLFSIRSYEAVAGAYIRALERRVQEGKTIANIASVASFFLSRIDVLADQLLGHYIIPERTRDGSPRPELLLGKVAVANAKLAFQSFKKIFSGERWKKLAVEGARVQRPLWASTSTKNPLYHDVKYVEPLIGLNTVNTMPEKTIQALADHGVIVENSVERDLDEAKRTLADLQEAGLDIDFITRQLVHEGVQKFIDPYDSLMKTLAERREQFRGDRAVRQEIAYGDLQSSVQSAYDELDAMQFGRRLFAKDPFLWKAESSHVEIIRKRLGWLDCVEEFSGKVAEITTFVSEIKNSYSHVVLLGMGGSSLSAEVGLRSLPVQAGWPRLLILDKTDPGAIRSTETFIDPTSTLFIVASKSGTTTETINFYNYFYGKLEKHFQERSGEHFIAITDPGTPLAEEARNRNFRRIFENPADIGGRYSALSYFGLMPMALSGIDISELLEHARQMRISCGPFIPAEGNPGVSLGALMAMAFRSGRDKVTFLVPEALKSFGDWVEQLLAESTGKEGLGLVPVVNEPLGSPDVYREDRLFIAMQIRGDENRKLEAALEQLEDNGHPVVRIMVTDIMQLGSEFFRWQVGVAAAAAVLGINPFDEPNVAESKKNTAKLLDQWQDKHGFGEGHRVFEENGTALYCNDSPEWLPEIRTESLGDCLSSFIRLGDEHDHVVLLPYLMQTQSRDQLLQEMRGLLRDKLKLATTVGYGPRYLHSTGQLHKGGPNNGLFLFITGESQETVEIPGEEFDFATLQHAQVLGDFQSLSDKKRRVLRIHLGQEIDNGLARLKETIGKLR